MTKKLIVWFRQDLRLQDNPALYHACQNADEIIPIYILDDENAAERKMGGASRVFLREALNALDESLDGALRLLKGKAEDILPQLIDEFQASGVYWNRCYEPWRISRDKKIKATLEESDHDVQSFNGSLLWEPWHIKNQQGQPYKVFTPYYRKGCMGYENPREVLDNLSNIRCLSKYNNDTYTSNSLDLDPIPRWDTNVLNHWKISEKYAFERLEEFLDSGVDNYKEGRNCPAQKNVSRLSPYLHFGLISPNQVWYEAVARGDDNNIDCFCSELGWREFSYYLLYHFPHITEENYNSKFDGFEWNKDDQAFEAWCHGRTGIPIVDAGMRELWQTGYMHNRVRMIVASFLTKNLRIDWREGEKWFWDTLFDADSASNTASWQWVAGSGADAAPYFRIFNPVTQAEKFDPDGTYIRQYVPELKNLPNKYLAKPWEAPKMILEGAGITLGKEYPKPICDLKTSRTEALEAYQNLS